LLLLAFASECLDRMKEEVVRSYLEGLIGNHLVTMEHAGAGSVVTGGEDQGRNWQEVG
jgi:hypothetical protein